MHDVDLAHAALVLGADEGVDERVGHLAGVLVGRLLREARPRLLDVPAAEAVVAGRLPPDQEGHRLLALATQQLLELGRRPQRVGVVATGQAAVAADDEHRHPLLIGLLLQQRVVDRRRLRGQGGDDPGDLPCVRLRGLHPLLRLDDARGSDELHRSGDLLGRLHRPDPAAVDPQLGAHD